jgi:hypothetical protein
MIEPVIEIYDLRSKDGCLEFAHLPKVLEGYQTVIFNKN